ncbi:hypothetical protein P59_221 [Bacillus phage P59]|nr:hypothetical protein P59_221 [Bacillus phage P59]
MNYKGSYGKEVIALVEQDLDGRKINVGRIHVVSFYIDGEDQTVGIYPLFPDGYTKSDILSFQPVQNIVFAEDLKELKSMEEYKQEIREAYACYEDWEEEELQVTWLEESGDHPEEWVLNVGTIVIEDGFKSEEQANALFYQLEGDY